MKYYFVAPFHIILTHFATYHLPIKILKKKILQQRKLSVEFDNLGIIDCFVDQPIQSFFIINFGILLVQIGFTLFLYKNKKFLSSSTRQNVKTVSNSSATSSENSNSINFLLLNFFRLLLQGPQSKNVIKLSNLWNQYWLVLKEWTIINLITIISTNVLIILMGSSTHSLDFIKRNFLLSCLISSLSFFPCSILFGWNQGRQKPNWIRLFSSFQPQNEYEAALLCPAVGTCLGCWLGAIPIPLDWDRPWQTWPITCLIGAVTGHAFGSIASIFWSELAIH